MRKLFTAILLLAISINLVSCSNGSKTASGSGSGTDRQEQSFSLKLGHSTSNTGIFQAGAEEFKRIVEEKTNGTVTVEIYPNSTLGADVELIQGLQLGNVDMCVTDTNNIASFIPEIQVFNLPYIFSSSKHAYEILDGQVGCDMLAKLDSVGIKGLAMWENGFRNLTNSKRPVSSASDVEGLKIRVMDSPLYIDMWAAMGADPTPMAWSEVFTALQQGTIDGQENPIAQIYANSVYEVNKYITLDRHVYAPAVLLVSLDVFNQMSENQQTAVLEAAVEAGIYEREYNAEMENEWIKEMVAAGAEIITDPDIASFQAAVAPVVEEYAESLGVSEIVSQIQEAGNNF